ncbi:Alpha/Beta hydrolase protein [Boeremia exigua]|uniref:Alpha/Beta hydrolase protein n=1 Tax=Boeremia exigua TaxID=749465 RepID=UPI001E8E2CEB|nr:Alpha/Beta hydrolase protein [Boeremia exigua]KAH6620102.1 Alpha/Beta hydrolase protein [Boeremia exigua]
MKLPFSSLILTILFNALLSNAAPFAAEKRAIDDNLLQTFRMMSQYASAAYCSNNLNSPGDQLQCGPGNCPLVDDADSATVLEYSRTETITDVTGFVATDHTNKQIVVSFRGSQSIDNWLTNLDFALVPTDLCTSCTAHAGFWQSWLDARATVVPAVKAAVANYPAYKITVTGHSLGGAIAAFAATQLRNLGLGVALYTFGSPRIGGPVLSAYVSGQSGGNYRVTHWNDPVPRMPMVAMGYVHVSPEYYVGVKNGAAVGTGDVKVYDGAVNLFKGNSAWLRTDVEAHRWYLSRMGICADLKQKRGLEGLGLDVVARF